MDTKNIIEIVEKGNRLDFKTSYTPIVCGNSGYYLKFEFDEKWQKCNRKTAILILENKKFAIDFEGAIVEVPPLPNSAWLHVALTSSYDDKVVMCTTTLKIRLEPSVVAEDITEFDPISAYFPKIIGTLNKFEQGDLVAGEANHSNTSTHATTASSAESAATALTANHAITADSATTAENSNYATTAGASATQVDLSTNQTISGTKNFIGELKINGKNVASTEQLNEQVEDLSSQVVEIKETLENFNTVELIYDKTSASSSLNKGYTSGIRNGETISGLNLSKYKSLIVYHEAYGHHYISFNDLTKPTITNNYFNQVCVEVIYDNDMAVTRAAIVGSSVNAEKTAITCKTFFRRITNTTEITTEGYYVYKIEGVI